MISKEEKMIEFVKVCGLCKIEIEFRLNQFKMNEVQIFVEENNLDGKIILQFEKENYLLASKLKSRICHAFSENFYSAQDIEIGEFAGKLLVNSDKILSIAESLTGGAVCATLVGTAGISKHLYEGIVCYDTDSKMKRLGVSEQTIQKFGAVSKETAFEMARGLLQNSKSTIAISTTGLAGPQPDEGKPVGLVFIGIGTKDFIIPFEHHFVGNRNQIREQTKNMALFYLIRYLQGNILMV